MVVHDTARTGWLTYETFYGLREKAFGLSSDPRFFYHSHSHARAFEDLLGGIRRRESLSVLSGDIGTGKTSLCRAVLQSLDRQTFSAFIPDPFASREDLLKMVLMEFGVISFDDLTSGRLNGASRTELSYLLYEFLGRLSPLQAFAVVVIDEAQNLSLSLLEELRILSDSDGRQRQLQIILVGQPELEQKLTLPEMRQVEQRIAVRCSLAPLTRDGAAGYVAHRLRIADGSPDRVAFSDDAFDGLHEASGGVPRLINRICDRALHHGHARRLAIIDRPAVEAAVADLGFDRTAPPPAAAVSDAPPERGSDPPPQPEASQTTVETWLMDVDQRVASPPAMPRQDDPAQTPPAADPSFLATGGKPPEHFSQTWDPSVPRTFLERVARRWLRRLTAIAVKGLMVGAAGLTVAVLWNLSTERENRAEPIAIPALPPAPAVRPAPALKVTAPPPETYSAVPALGNYVIQIAVFQNDALAHRSVDVLTDAGYPVFRTPVDLGAKGLRHRILAGPYATRADAERDLSRLHQTADYRDARAVQVP